MGPVIDSKKETDENSPKILSQMDHHIGNKKKTGQLFFM